MATLSWFTMSMNSGRGTSRVPALAIWVARKLKKKITKIRAQRMALMKNPPPPGAPPFPLLSWLEFNGMDPSIPGERPLSGCMHSRRGTYPAGILSRFGDTPEPGKKYGIIFPPQCKKRPVT